MDIARLKLQMVSGLLLYLSLTLAPLDISQSLIEFLYYVSGLCVGYSVALLFFSTPNRR